jgi:hypothetical protein
MMPPRRLPPLAIIARLILLRIDATLLPLQRAMLAESARSMPSLLSAAAATPPAARCLPLRLLR